MNDRIKQLLIYFDDESFNMVIENRSYIPLLVTYTKEDAEINGLRKAKSTDIVDREPKYFSALEALERSKRVVFLGEKGMGKSTFLKMLTLCMIGEMVKDEKHNLIKISEPIVRSDTGFELERQSWDAGVLNPFWLDVSRLIEEGGFGKNFPGEVEKAQLVLIDGIENVQQKYWAWIANEIDKLQEKNPSLYIAVACEADVINRLRPRLSGFTSYMIKALTNAQKKQIARFYFPDSDDECLQKKVSLMPSQLTETLSITQNYFLWMRIGQRTNNVESFYRNLLIYCQDSCKQADNNPEFIAFQYFMGKLEKQKAQQVSRIFGFNENLLKYLACVYCIDNEFEQRLGELVLKMGYESWSIIRILKQIIREKDATIFLQRIIELCPTGEPRPENCIQALFSADLLFEIRDLVQISNDSFMLCLRKWISAIVCNGWLTIYDRIIAGKRLSWLGDNRLLDGLVSIPAGSFTMGDYWHPNHQPVTTVTVSSFKMGIYPIVNNIYREFIRDTGRFWISKEQDDCERQNYPAIDLSWHDAVAFCDWLTSKWRDEKKITGTEIVRLPTEAEWEYAARGKIISEKDKFIFSWGNEWQDDRCNTQELGLNDTCAVGIFPDNISGFGCRDMNGLVWEWNSTLWGEDPKTPDFSYPYNLVDGRERSRTASDSVRRCMRGGSFGSTADHATCCYRGGLEPIGFWRGDGFRIVVSEAGYDK